MQSQAGIDFRNAGLILLGFGIMVALVPPVRFYPINDDWAYVHSVSDLSEWSYKIPDWAQATSIGHIAWGALFSLAFGQSFTALTWATLLMGAAGALLFYGLLRHLDIAPAYALLGAALLSFNPMYVYLCYSFMTDITFLVYFLAASLCFVRAMQGRGEHWLWLGSVAAALAYLTRQFGLLIVAAALFFLWWSCKWTWRRALAITVIPLGAFVLFTLWERSQPTPLISYYLDDLRARALSNLPGAVLDRSQTIAASLMLPALCLGVLLPLRHVLRRRLILWALPLFGVLTALNSLNLMNFGSVFPANGNVLFNGGFYTCCNIAPIWPQAVWTLLGLFASLVGTLLLIWLTGEILRWWKTRPWERRADTDPTLMLYVCATLFAAATLFITPLLFDRYLLPVIPMLIVAALRRLQEESGRRKPESRGGPLLWRVVLVAFLASFSLIAQADSYARAAARWRAAEGLAAQGISRSQIYAGFEWEGWYLYDEGERRMNLSGNLSHVIFPPEAVLDPEYAVMELTGDEYARIGSVPYWSWLQGGRTAEMLLLKRK